jgi:hypothetical protein
MNTISSCQFFENSNRQQRSAARHSSIRHDGVDQTRWRRSDTMASIRARLVFVRQALVQVSGSLVSGLHRHIDACAIEMGPE